MPSLMAPLGFVKAAGIIVVAFLLAETGCSPSGKPEPHAKSDSKRATESAPETASSAKAPHAHEHPAPHGGTLVVLGEEFAHVEFVLDATTGALTAYILDGGASRGVPLAAPTFEVLVKIGDDWQTMVMEQRENALTGETRGNSSEYFGVCEGLRDASRFEARLPMLEIKGQKFSEVGFVFPEGNE